MADTPPSRAAREPAPSFETALTELQQIVRELEDGSLGLEESMQRFETGIRLLRGCHAILEQAEQKIEILTGFDREGFPVTRPFDATATFEQNEPSAGRRKSKKGAAAEPKPASAAPAEAAPAELPPDTDPDRGNLKRLF